MKSSAIFVLALGPASAFSAGLVSAYDFGGSLAPFVDNNPGHVASLLHQNGNANPTDTLSNYSSDMVGTVTKQVLDIAYLDTLSATHGIGVNGGGSYVNQYTILMDVKFDGEAEGNYSSLFNTSADNSNDGDSFLQWQAGNVATIGISGDYAGSVSGDVWHRLAVAVDLSGTGTITYYLDGAQIHQHSTGVDVDGRWALYTYDDNDADSDSVYIFGDEDVDSATGKISQLAFYDHALTLQEFQALGDVGQPVPEPATMIALGLGSAAFLRRRKA